MQWAPCQGSPSALKQVTGDTPAPHGDRPNVWEKLLKTIVIKEDRTTNNTHTGFKIAFGCFVFTGE